MFDSTPVLHPDDEPAPDEDGPWLTILVVSGVAWLALATLDWRLLSEGTVVWATVKNLYTLLLAPLAAAALLQDTRALGVVGVEVGPLKWLYTAVALLFPPVGAVYVLHRRALTGRRPVSQQ